MPVRPRPLRWCPLCVFAFSSMWWQLSIVWLSKYSPSVCCSSIIWRNYVLNCNQNQHRRILANAKPNQTYGHALVFVIISNFFFNFVNRLWKVTTATTKPTIPPAIRSGATKHLAVTSTPSPYFATITLYEVRVCNNWKSSNFENRFEVSLLSRRTEKCGCHLWPLCPTH